MSNGNEPAYPTQEIRDMNGNGVVAPSFGLTKRELIAAMAMQGLINVVNVAYFDQQTYNNVATDAVNYADALLEALNESK